MRVIGGTSAYGSVARVHEQPPAAEFLLDRVIHRHRRARDRRSRRRCRRRRRRSAAAPVLTSMNFITGSVQMNLRLTASWFGNSRCARLWLTITTFSLSARSPALKSRPAMTGTPSEAKKPGDTVRNRAARIVLAVGLRVAFDRELRGEEGAGLAPRHQRADRDLLDAGQLRDAPDRFAIERQRLRPAAASKLTGTCSASTLRVLMPGVGRAAARTASSAACPRRRAARTTRRSASPRTAADGGWCPT